MRTRTMNRIDSIEEIGFQIICCTDPLPFCRYGEGDSDPAFHFFDWAPRQTFDLFENIMKSFCRSRNEGLR